MQFMMKVTEMGRRKENKDTFFKKAFVNIGALNAADSFSYL